jgi:hypothetical protein
MLYVLIAVTVVIWRRFYRRPAPPAIWPLDPTYTRQTGFLSMFRNPAPLTEYLASVALNVICVSTSVRPLIASVSHNPSAPKPLIAVPNHHDCEPLHLFKIAVTVGWLAPTWRCRRQSLPYDRARHSL